MERGKGARGGRREKRERMKGGMKERTNKRTNEQTNELTIVKHRFVPFRGTAGIPAEGRSVTKRRDICTYVYTCLTVLTFRLVLRK
jgi:hypothetical protein